MSRTIRRKGWNRRTSALHSAQYNNEFYHIDKNYYMYSWDIPGKWEQRKKWLDEIANEVHRESSYVEERWYRYAMPIPRNKSKMELTKSLRSGSDYDWDEKAARKYEKGLCVMLWD
jgi:hypothetical protein